MKNSYIKEFIKILKENEETIFGDVSSEDSLKRRAGKTVLSGKIRDKNIVDLLIKISKGGFWISKSKASKDEIAAYQKFLSGLGYEVNIDGIFGPQTKGATKELQGDLFVDKIDGFFGKSTLISLTSQLKDGQTRQIDKENFKKAFPDSTLGEEVIYWLTNDPIPSKKTKKDIFGKSEQEQTREPGYYDITFGDDGNPSVPAVEDLAKAIEDELGISVTSSGRGPSSQARVAFQYPYGLDALVRKYDPSIEPGSYFFADHPKRSIMIPKINNVIKNYNLGNPVSKGVYSAYRSKTYQNIFKAYEKGKDYIQQAGVRGSALQNVKGKNAGEEFWSEAETFWENINKLKAKAKRTGHATGYAIDISPRASKKDLQKVADKFGLKIQSVKFEADHNHVNIVNKSQNVSENKKLTKILESILFKSKSF